MRNYTDTDGYLPKTKVSVEWRWSGWGVGGKKPKFTSSTVRSQQIMSKIEKLRGSNIMLFRNMKINTKRISQKKKCFGSVSPYRGEIGDGTTISSNITPFLGPDRRHKGPIILVHHEWHQLW